MHNEKRPVYVCKFFCKFYLSTNLTADGVGVQYLKITFICGYKFLYVKRFWMQKVLYMANKYF